jgi:hypothetical protein
MNQTIMYNNYYKFDLKLEQSSVSIKFFDTVSLELFEGLINENHIYNSIAKFYKMLINALNKEKDFTIKIDKTSTKIKCILLYKNQFIELEEIFSLNRVANYPMQYKITKLEATNKKLEAVKFVMEDKIIKLEATNKKLEKQKDLKTKRGKYLKHLVLFLIVLGVNHFNVGSTALMLILLGWFMNWLLAIFILNHYDTIIIIIHIVFLLIMLVVNFYTGLILLIVCLCCIILLLLNNCMLDTYGADPIIMPDTCLDTRYDADPIINYVVFLLIVLVVKYYVDIELVWFILFGFFMISYGLWQ